jgi:raffinose/stachyose/melibiose transport system permease protein
MKIKEKTSRVVLKTVVAILIAVYVLFPFFLVVINSCKTTNDITANPIGLNGVSISNLITI